MAKNDVPAEDESLTDWEARRKRIFKEAIRETFIEFGMDPDKPLELQQDMAWARRRRLAEQSLVAKIIATAVGAIVMGAIGTLLTGLRDYFH